MPRQETARVLSAATGRAAAREILADRLFRGESVANLRVHKVWPKPGGRFVVLYAADGPQGAARAAAHLFPPENRLGEADVPPLAVHVPEWNGFVQRFPDDFRMRHLGAAMDPDRAASMISPLLERQGRRWTGFAIRRAEPRGYWPGKRCQIEYHGTHPGGAAGRLFAKVYREENGSRMTELHHALRKAGFDGRRGLLVPRPIAYCPGLRASLMEPGEGDMVLGLLDAPAAPDIVFRAGHLLAALHATDIPPPNPSHRAQNEIEILNGWQQVLRLISPPRARTVDEICGRLAGVAGDAQTPLRASHRDFYDKQLLCDGTSMTVLDLDTACLAPAELDAGNFLAHLSLRGLQRTGDAGRYGGLSARFVEGYLGSGGLLSPPALAWFRASSLLRLACRYVLQPGGAAYFDSLISMARTSVRSIQEPARAAQP